MLAEYCVSIPASCFGVIQCDVGLTYRLVCIKGAILYGHSDAGTNRDLRLLDLERQSKVVHNGFCNMLGLQQIVRCDKDGKFITTDPRNKTVGQKAREPRPDK